MIIISILLMVAGVFLAIVMVVPGMFGIAVSPGFGPAQMLGTVAGSILILAGFILLFAISRSIVKKVLASKFGLILLGIIVSLLLVEIAVQVLSAIAPSRDPTGGVALSQPIQDSRLGLRIAPNAEGHDSLGFRNEFVPEDADIVVIGDSQTWGINARRSEAWPQVLGHLTGRVTYNMGLGFYGPAQYWALAEEAVVLSPEVVVIALYFGNDIWGAYYTVYGNDTYERFRDPQLVDELSIDTVGEASREISKERLAYVESIPVGAFEGLNEWLVNYSGIVGILSGQGWWFNVGDSARASAAMQWARAFPDRGEVYEAEGYSTVFLTAYRFMALDIAEPRIAEGLRVTNDLLSAASTYLETEGVRLLVVLIPTKETVFASQMKGAGVPVEGTLGDLVEAELKVKTKVVERLDVDDIHYVDTLPRLSDAAGKGEKIYRPIEDGHPTPAGYMVIATVVAEELVELDW